SSFSLRPESPAEAEAQKQERAEKIREKRRSRTISLDASAGAGLAAAAAAIVGGKPPSPAPLQRKSPEGESGVGVVRRQSVRESVSPQPQGWSAAAPGGGGGWNQPPNNSNSNANGVPHPQRQGSVDPWAQPPPAAGPGPFAGSQWASPTPPASPAYNGGNKDARRRSTPVPVPAGPPAGGGWSTPAGLQPPPAPSAGAVSSTSSPAPIKTGAEGGVILASGRAARSSPSPVPASPATPGGGAPASGDGILLASGRAARAAAQAAAAVQAATTSPSPDAPEFKPTEKPDGSILIASGRRRSRTASVSNPDLTGLNAGAPSTPTTTAPTTPQPWGANPQVWTNPAQLTSASSTWSTQPAPQPTSQFVDPWARPPNGSFAPASNDPWAAPPQQPAQQAQPQYASAAPAQQQWGAPPQHSNTGYGQPQQQLHHQPSHPSLRMAAGAGWSMPSTATTPPPSWDSQTQGGHNTPPKSPAPPSYFDRSKAYGIGVRNGGVAGVGNGHGVGGMNGGQGAGGQDGFVFSNPRRGKMLLKLKIETRSGGHQTLAVHEFDDAVALATEFCTYWDMAAFREPLVRLISVRKANALRQMRVH
ncbi:hypothetical protein HK104_009693, partial [Borealophlyctis nickersoniae]